MSALLESEARTPRRTPRLGVLGGMGPLATALFYRYVVEATTAAIDQEHLPVVIWSDPSVPDRTAALVGSGRSPLKALADGLQHLESCGATAIAVPCNTAHAYTPDLRLLSAAPILEMPSIAVANARMRITTSAAVGLLATRGTRYAKLYDRAIDKAGLELVHPTTHVQRKFVDRAISLAKAGDVQAATRALATAADHLRQRGASVLIAGCTELSLCLDGRIDIALGATIVDSTRALAGAAVSEIRRQQKSLV